MLFTTSPWPPLFISLSLTLLAFLVAWIEGAGVIGAGARTRTWLGANTWELAGRAVLGLVAMFAAWSVSGFCWYLSCREFPVVIGVFLNALALLGWPLQALVLGVAYALTLLLWGRVWAVGNGFVSFIQWLIFIGSAGLVYARLRELVPALQRHNPVGWFSHILRDVPTALSELRDQSQANKPVVVASNVMPAAIAGSSLYMLTLIVEAACALVRTIVLYLPLFFVLLPIHVIVFQSIRDAYYGPVMGFWGPTEEYSYNYGEWLSDGFQLAVTYTLVITLLLGFAPVLRSLFHTLWPFGRSGSGWSDMEVLGARHPTRTEVATIIDALEKIKEQADGSVAAPSDYRIIDYPTPDAYTIGSTVYLARGAVEHDNLIGILAHELGHLAHKDGDLLLALRRFIIPVAYYVGIDRHPMPAGAVIGTGGGTRQLIIRSEDEKIYYRFQTLKIKFWLAFWLGGIGMLLLGQQWARFWRQRDFLADDYVVQLGAETNLMSLLEVYRHVDVAQPFLMSNRPYTAERLDRLRG